MAEVDDNELRRYTDQATIPYPGLGPYLNKLNRTAMRMIKEGIVQINKITANDDSEAEDNTSPENIETKPPLKLAGDKNPVTSGHDGKDVKSTRLATLVSEFFMDQSESDDGPRDNDSQTRLKFGLQADDQDLLPTLDFSTIELENRFRIRAEGNDSSPSSTKSETWNLKDSHLNFQRRHAKAQEELNELHERHSKLHGEHNQLSTDYSQLKIEHTTLEVEDLQLGVANSGLEEKITLLELAKADVGAKVDELSSFLHAKIKVMESTMEEHGKALGVFLNKHAETIPLLKSAHTEEIERLQSGHGKTIEDLRSELTTASKAALRAKEAEINSLQIKIDGELKGKDDYFAHYVCETGTLLKREKELRNKIGAAEKENVEIRNLHVTWCKKTIGANKPLILGS